MSKQKLIDEITDLITKEIGVSRSTKDASVTDRATALGKMEAYLKINEIILKNQSNE